MCRQILILWLLVFGGVASFSQNVLKGRVIAADTRKPVGLANVYLSNTAIGTISADNGDFSIHPFPSGRFDLVVSFIGYETYTVPLQSTALPSFLEVVIKPKVNELKEVVLRSYEKEGWEKWGSLFMEHFIGTSANAEGCKLLNRKAIKFRYDKKLNILQAFANETLLLENRSLGYKIKYDLVQFEYDFSQHLFSFQGYPFFEDIKTSRTARKRRWEQKRADAYGGSLMHFMRSLYRNNLANNHFEVRKIIKVSEAEKKRVKNVYRAAAQSTMRNGQVHIENPMKKFPADTAEYYRKIMREPDKLNILVNQLLPGDSLAYAVDSTTAGLYFNNHLQVVYLLKKTPKEYVQYNRLPATIANESVTSEITLTIDMPIHVLSNGSFYVGIGLISSGYWGWWEKLANMLPYEYAPVADKL